MGKAARAKAERRVTPSPAAGGGGAASQRSVWIVTGVVALAVAIGVGVYAATRSSSKPPPPSANASSINATAPAALVKAADKINFKPTTEPGVGTMEGKPASAAQQPANPDLLAVGTTAPAFSLKTPLGVTHSLAQYKGKAVLLEFFATWCPHCQAEAPHLQKLYESLPKTTYQFLAVNGDGEEAPSVFAFDRYFGLTYPSLLDPSSNPGSFTQAGAPGQVSQAYHLQYFPTMYVVDPQGKITWHGDGEQPDALLKQELEKAASG
jgi:peroxiredoxin